MKVKSSKISKLVFFSVGVLILQNFCRGNLFAEDSTKRDYWTVYQEKQLTLGFDMLITEPPIYLGKPGNFDARPIESLYPEIITKVPDLDLYMERLKIMNTVQQVSLITGTLAFIALGASSYAREQNPMMYSTSLVVGVGALSSTLITAILRHYLLKDLLDKYNLKLGISIAQ